MSDSKRHKARVYGHSFLYEIKCGCGWSVGGMGNEAQAKWIRDKHNKNPRWKPKLP